MDHKTLSETLSERLGVAREEIGIMLHALAESVEVCASENDIVTIPGFGSFEPRKRLERVAVHPATGKRMLYPPKISLTFRPSTMLRRQLRDDNQPIELEDPLSYEKEGPLTESSDIVESSEDQA